MLPCFGENSSKRSTLYLNAIDQIATRLSPAMLARKPARVVTVAVANRAARVAWAIMTRGGAYRAPAALAS